jgi:branched-chain amino acid transport system substrate-binding protein
LTGNFAASGPAFAKASGLAVQEAQKALKAAGIKDIKIQIEHVDDESTTAGAVAATRKVIQNGADCVIGALSSASTIALAQGAAIPAGIPVISPSASAPAVTELDDRGLVFRVAPSDTLQGAVLASVIASDLGRGATVALAGRDDAFGRGILPAVEKGLIRAGLKTTGPTYFDPAATSYDSEAAQIVRPNPDAYVVIDFPQTYGKIGAALLRTGRFRANRVYVAGSWPATIPSFVPEQALEGARGTRPGAAENTKVWAAFDALFKRTRGTTTRASSDQNTFDATMLCILSAIAGKSSKGTDIAKNLQRVSAAPGRTYSYLNLAAAIKALRAGKDINYVGVGGGDDLDANGDVKSSNYVVYRFVNGNQETVRTVRARR